MVVMAKLHYQQPEWSWPPELATYDPERWESKAAWHLARSHAAPNRLAALQEIRASVQTNGDDDRGRVRLLVIDNCEHVLDSAADLSEAILVHSATVPASSISRTARPSA
jgi:hypothetical protein